jgi:hypothetical protein
MPREGIFGIVTKGGRISVGDPVTVSGKKSATAALVASDSDEKKFGSFIRTIINEEKAPAFIRFDSLDDKNRDLSQILADLTETQKIDTIVIFDPSGSHGLALAGYEKTNGKNTDARYTMNSSTIHLCMKMDDLSLSQ